MHDILEISNQIHTNTYESKEDYPLAINTLNISVPHTDGGIGSNPHTSAQTRIWPWVRSPASKSTSEISESPSPTKREARVSDIVTRNNRSLSSLSQELDMDQAMELKVISNKAEIVYDPQHVSMMEEELIEVCKNISSSFFVILKTLKVLWNEEFSLLLSFISLL